MICITSKFYLKSFLLPSSFGVKSGCNRIGLKSTFLEPENIIYHCLVLGFLDSFHGIPTDFSKTTWEGVRARGPSFKIAHVRQNRLLNTVLMVLMLLAQSLDRSQHAACPTRYVLCTKILVTECRTSS